MTDRPYTDDDLRTEAAEQYATALRDLDFMGIGEQMTDETWRNLSRDDFEAAQRAIDDLLTDAADVSEWAISLGVAGLAATTSIGFYCTSSGWDYAVQLAHRPQIKAEVRDEIESAVRLAVERVLKDHGLSPRVEITA